MNMYGRLESFLVYFTIEIGNNTQTKAIEAPRIMLEQQFINYVQQAYNNPSPIRITMSRADKIWNQFENKLTDTEYKIVYSNKAWENSGL